MRNASIEQVRRHPGPWWPWYRLSRRLPAAAPSASSRATAVRCQRVMQVRTGDAGWVVAATARGVDSAGRRARGANARGEHPQPVHRARQRHGDAGALPGAGGVAVAAATVAGGVDMPLNTTPKVATARWRRCCSMSWRRPRRCRCTCPCRPSRAGWRFARRSRRARHPRQRRTLGRVAAYQPAQFQPHLPSLHRPQLRCLEATRLRGRHWRGLAGGETVTAIAPGLRLPEPGSLLDHVPPGPRPAAQRLPGGALRSPGGP